MQFLLNDILLMKKKQKKREAIDILMVWLCVSFTKMGMTIIDSIENGKAEEEIIEARQDYVINKMNPTKSPEKVQVTEQVQIIEQNGNQKSEVIEETVDDEAGGFELCKWKTFKLP
ncbi:hypothetical protein NC651_033974 [Populus alba x Populus x berolinensis]|nr:hypothetical protein NC651_033974 [Populus alba x Populus x berolinensis]